MSRLHVSLLGSPVVERDGRAVDFDTRKAVALLAYLAITGRPHARDHLAGLLWPDADTDRSRAALRRTLSTLGKGLGGGWLRADRSTIALDTDRLVLDVRRFQQLLTGSPDDLEEAAALYRGDFMAGFALRDADTFDEWQFFQAEELRRQLSGALESLVRALTAQDRHDAAIGHARRWLALDSLHEPAHRQLMRLHAAAGQRGLAVRQYRECVRVLDTELGVPPLEETTDLYRAIEQGRIRPEPPPAAPQAPARPARVGSWPLVGRDREVKALRSAYRAIGQHGYLVVVQGEAGIGKTRLAEELVDLAAGEGAVAVGVRCYEGESDLAFAPVTTALRAAVERVDTARLPVSVLAEAARLLPELPVTASRAPVDQPAARARFFDAITELLGRALSDAAAGVLFVDDLHWADEASLDALAYLVRRLERRRVAVLVTWRYLGSHRDERLRALLGDARRQAAGVTVVSPEPLSRDEVASLADATPGIDDPQAVAGRVHADTGGVPLLVVEFLDALAAGDLSAVTGASELPVGVRDLLMARASTVTDTARQVLTAAAVLGRSFDVDLVREVSGRTDDEVVTALEELAARALVVEREGGYDVRHARLRDLVYAETSLARRRLLHRRIAEALLARHRRDLGPQAAWIAHHHRGAGADAAAAETHRLAGAHARALGAHADAVEHLHAALALGHPDRAALQEALGDVHTLQGRYGDALASYETAAAAAGRARLPHLEHRLGQLHQRRGDPTMAAVHLDAALAHLVDGGDLALRARITADASLNAAQLGHGDRSDALALEALALAEESAEPLALAQAHNVLGILCIRRGALEDARRHLQASLRLTEATPEPGASVAARNNLARVHAKAGDHATALAMLESALRDCQAQGDRHREAALRNNLADVLHADGRDEEAMEQLKQAVTLFAEVGGTGQPQPEIWKLVEW